ncbi:hypothetical protein INT43_008915 [Umbelopsis isabellina]|uniref:DUF4396 domain-containing protein n=1 Tax=Mortierella isabellina TaxID=91625 RepID=A0A8H7PVY1_MORIS|nr:hypothetical protein INT43_008915 [Umbelopsis isabellina]
MSFPIQSIHSICKLSATSRALNVTRRWAATCSSHNSDSSKSCHKPKAPAITSSEFWSDPTTWQRTRVNTFRCLIGCTTGDFSSMWYLQLYHPDVAPVTCMAISMAAGITTSLALETVLLRRSMGVTHTAAFKTALGMSFVSMLAMEATENAVDWYFTGGQVMLQDPKFWVAAAASAAAGYIVPLPYNYWRLRALGVTMPAPATFDHDDHASEKRDRDLLSGTCM